MSPAPARAPREGERLRALAIVPARLGSRRLARKMLLDDTGAPLFEHTARNVLRCRVIQRVVVATDAEQVLECARAAGLEAVATRADHASGTDRCEEALSIVGAQGWDVVANVQGDEPELDPADLERLVAAFADPGVELATLAGPLAQDDHARPQVVKVVRDARGDALYFSRAPIPYRPAAGEEAAYARADAPAWSTQAHRHVGVYAFRPAALRAFCALPRGALEALENLEQLRWLEAGRRMRVVEAKSVPLGIDTREDYDAFVERVRRTRAGGAG
jgi:3-deoxy-manno-octulosonate cytidylyltransferase (CMP-KDO synthetase)